jgi:YceI-like domain
MFTLVRARFTLFSGAVVIDPASPETTQIAVDIDASSVDSATAWRDTHLRGEECFVIERHSSIAVRLGVRRARRGALRGGGRADDPRSHPAGATRRRPVRSSAGRGRQPWARLGATARLQRARSGITWNAPVLGGGVALADEVDLELDAQDRMTVLCPAVDLRRSRAASGDPQGVPRSVLAALALRSRGR